MVKLNTIISNNVLKENNYYNVENTYEKINTTKLIDNEEDYEYWIFNLYRDLNKKLYKKSLKDINNNIKKFKFHPKYHNIILLKVKIILKILDNKIYKYNFNNDNYLIQKQIKHIKKYAQIIFENLTNIFYEIRPDLNVNININNQLNLIDKIINYLFQYLYILIMFYKKCNKIEKCISILIIALNFSNKVLQVIKTAKTLNIIEKIYIDFSYFFILNKDYENSILYLEKSMYICFRELFYYSTSTFSLDYDYLKKKKTISYNIYSNIIIIFLYRGICKENEALIKKAIESYKECKWFIDKFINEESEELKYKINQLLLKITKRGFMYKETIDYIQLKLKLYKKIQNRKKNSIFYNDEEIKNIASGNYFDDNKFKNVIEKIETIRHIPEINTNKFFPSQKKKVKDLLLSNMRLLEAYLSEDFKGIIEGMNQIKLFDLDYSTREKIQKEFNRRLFLSSFRKKKIKQKIISISQNNDNNRYSFKSNSSKSDLKMEISNNKKLDNSSKLFSKSLICKLKKDKINNIKYNQNYHSRQIHSINLKLNSKSINISNSPINKNLSEERKNKTMIFFNKNYRTKINYIKGLTDREIKFQKDLLSLKKGFKENIPLYNKFLCEKKADSTFEKIRLFSSIKGEHFDLMDKYSEEEFKEIKKESLLKNCIVKSLTDKAILNYKLQIIDKRNKENNKNNNNSNNNIDEYFCEEDIDNRNKSAIVQLEQKIENLDKITERNKKRGRIIEKYFFNNNDKKTKNNKEKKLIKSKSSFIIRKIKSNLNYHNFIYSVLSPNNG